jgi:hypothetical protein
MILIEPGASYKPRSMYPCEVHAVNGHGVLQIDDDSTAYGYLSKGTLSLQALSVQSGQYFCLTRLEPSARLEYVDASGFIVIRRGFKGLGMVGGPLELSGRLVYIDGCSDTLLVSPPRFGDPSLNHLHFPSGITQSFHIHPSIRAGIVVSGEGEASLSNDGAVPLRSGTVFVLDERERHRFLTLESEMHIVAFHPDGDFGPTDSNHPMKNRTLITGR